ncbi:MAG: hypothetical protein M3R70_00330 [Actinomycetota bacterium]|nr:hypothetical protein [Actinomycetota bacterium]
MPIDPHVVALLVGTTGVGFLMTFAGLQKSALEWRRQRRICPSCGHEIRSKTCACSL